MDIAKIPDRLWKKVLQEESNHDYESLSLRILLARLKLKLRMNPGTNDECISELKGLFISQGNLPSLQRDIEKIMAKGGLS